MKKTLLLLVLVGSVLACAAREGTAAEMKKGPWVIEPDPALPNVLILGDSISIGYTVHVRKELAGKANVFRPCKENGAKPENCEGTTMGIREIDRWLAGRKWDVIHFNWGLHDLKHVHPDTGKNSASLDDPRQADPETYKRNLTELVGKLKATGATLIFAATTPFPDGTRPARLPADAERYNDVAMEIMKANNIRVNNLYGLAKERLAELQHPKNVHFTRKGSAVLGDQVVQCIDRALEDRALHLSNPRGDGGR